ncbi:MAG: hypothetical protein U9532_02930 ['Conium maculatum' witches'-broom phytoplasma]|nr:hypothetical protein ['Conium maculatum' witches'-broom phytoplasma]
MNKTVKICLIFSLLIIMPIFLIKMNTNYAAGGRRSQNISANDTGGIPDNNRTADSTGNKSSPDEQKKDETKDQENGNGTKKKTSKVNKGKSKEPKQESTKKEENGGPEKKKRRKILLKTVLNQTK